MAKKCGEVVYFGKDLKINIFFSSGWFSSITSMVGNMFVSGDEMTMRVEQMKALNSALLSFYEAVHRNRNFSATLGNEQINHAHKKAHRIKFTFLLRR